MVGLLVAGGAAAFAVVYGAVVALAASLLLVWRERHAMRHPEWDGRRLFGVFIRTGLERFVLVTLMLGLGLGILKLSALPLLTGLALAQLAWLVVALSYKKAKTSI
jgi:hypothetical protein